MVLLFIDSLLLLFITLQLGIFATNGLARLFRTRLQPDILGIFLTGLIFSTVYFSILSFWLPVNYLTLVPLACISLFIVRRNKAIYHQLFASAREFLTRPYLPFTLPLFLLLAYNWILPPGNGDSKGYHYQSILWYEMYKLVPGLGNIHGRYAFNPAAFILQSPYSFTHLTGQSLYPLNGIIITLFFLWFLKRTVQNRGSARGIVYFLLNVVFFRMFPINVSSPSSDALVGVCLFYGMFKCFELISDDKLTLATASIPLLVLVFAPIAKLSAYPVLIVVLYIFYFVLPRAERRLSHTLWYFAIGLLIYLPWIGRNIMMSGYLAYPIPFLDFFHPDWKMPREVLYVDYFMINYWIKGLGVTSQNMQRYADFHAIPMKEWFFSWLRNELAGVHRVTALLLIASIFSPLTWAIPRLRKRKQVFHLFVLWLIQYACIWNWLNVSPDFRFGIVFITMSLAIPLLLLAPDHADHALEYIQVGRSRNIPRILVPALYGAFALFFVYKAHIRPGNYPYTLKTCWLYPLKDIQYSRQNDRTNFPYKVMRSGVKLYLSDQTHHCLNADGPCMSWKYGDIRMRGPRIENGFYNARVEMGGAYPF